MTKYFRFFSFYLAILGVWLVVVSIMMQAWIPYNIVLLSLSLLSLTIVLSITRLFRNSGWYGVGLGITIFVAVTIQAHGMDSNALISVSVFSIVMLITGILSNTIGRKILITDRLTRQNAILIESLKVFDEETGLAKWKYARKALLDEITRCQRYGHDVCVLLIDTAESSIDETENVVENTIDNELSRFLIDHLRTVDIPFCDRYLGAILPETKPAGAMVVAERLVDVVSRRLHKTIYIGISVYPDDGIIPDDLYRSAEAAHRYGQNEIEQIILHSQIHGTEPDSKGEPDNG